MFALGPQPSTMRFDDRAADRQAEPQTGRFGRIEGIEKALQSHRRQSRPESRTATCTASDSVFSVLISTSRGASFIPLIASMALMVKLRITCCSCTRSPSIGGKPSASCVRTETPFFIASPCVRATTSRTASLIATVSFRGRCFLDQRTDPTDNLVRAIAVLHDATKRQPDLIEIWPLRAQPAQTGMGIGHRRGDRLVHFMGDRGRELPHRRDAVGVRELGLYLAISPFALARFGFGPFALGQIEHEGDTLVLAFFESSRYQSGPVHGCRPSGNTPSRTVARVPSPRALPAARASRSRHSGGVRSPSARDLSRDPHAVSHHAQKCVICQCGIRRPASNGSAVSNPAAGTTCRSGHPRMVC